MSDKDKEDSPLVKLFKENIDKNRKAMEMLGHPPKYKDTKDKK